MKTSAQVAVPVAAVAAMVAVKAANNKLRNLLKDFLRKWCFLMPFAQIIFGFSAEKICLICFKIWCIFEKICIFAF